MATDVDSTSLIEFNMIPTFISDELVPGLHPRRWRGGGALASAVACMMLCPGFAINRIKQDVNFHIDFRVRLCCS